MRITDKVWSDFLTHLRIGQVQRSELETLRKQIIGSPSCPKVDFDLEPWNDSSLVTPRHAVRTQWNEACVRKHCRLKKTKLFICTADISSYHPVSNEPGSSQGVDVHKARQWKKWISFISFNVKPGTGHYFFHFFESVRALNSFISLRM